ncbi:AMP-dependent synthetase/ligase [Pseudocnuella soli]|uniref:AMP-dependent synthetase/ligase n=1 Tax=Pseudocnuella soli TaxID=2502779 RepID=UPI0010521EF9|nr:long-chain fatty acid--CoA ligase [Pseudocnuella soli]
MNTLTPNMPQRLFDLVDYQLQQFPLPDMMAAKEAGEWRRYSTAEVKQLSERLAAGLLEAGISGGDGTWEGRDKVALISKNRPEWVLLDLAVQQIGAVLVPLYPTVHPSELQYILEHAQVKMLVVNDAQLLEKAEPILPQLNHLQSIYTFEKIAGELHWEDLLVPADEVPQQTLAQLKASITPEDLATIIYTSGTTGVPKGVMLSHRNVISNIMSCYPLFKEIGIRGDKALSFLPLNHAFEKTATYLYFYTGVSIYYAQSTATIAEDLQDVQPVIFTTVPRLLEKVYEKIQAKGAELSGVKKGLFDWSLRLASAYEINRRLGPWYEMQLALANKLVFSKWRAALGGRVRAIITGAAACQVKLLRIFAAAGINIMEGYGMTEASPVISGNRYHKSGRRFGTVGPVLDGVTVKLAADGEILVKGANVMLGYYKQPELTAETVRDGWLHTGDIGVWEEDRFLKITDRKKEMFKTSGGKYVAPQPIENSMVQSRWIEQLMVTGAGEKFVSALIVPAFNVLKEWYANRGKTYPGNEAVVQDNEVHQIIQKEVQQYNKQFNQVEQVKKFQLIPAEWTIEGGELTHTLKLRRKQILEKYQHLLHLMYTESRA